MLYVLNTLLGESCFEICYHPLSTIRCLSSRTVAFPGQRLLETIMSWGGGGGRNTTRLASHGLQSDGEWSSCKKNFSIPPMQERWILFLAHNCIFILK